MTREDIIKLARQAGAIFDHMAEAEAVAPIFERFAALVAAAERSACAKVCEEMDHNGVMIAADCAAAIRARGEK